MNQRSLRSLSRIGLAAVAAALLSCSGVSKMRGEIAGLCKLADQAERNGAVRCAPRELALAKAHIRFATTDLDQGQYFKGESHLGIARANAQAAYDLSPPAKCAERGAAWSPAGRGNAHRCQAAARPNSAASNQNTPTQACSTAAGVPPPRSARAPAR